MRAALTFLLGWIGIATAMQSFAADVDPNSGCPPDDPAAHRQRPGEGSPDRLQPEECDPTRLPTPTTSPLSGSIPVDRWRIVDALGHPANITDPYNTNNVLKGDRPIRGKDGFSVLTASTTSLFESRHLAAQQFFNSQTASIDAVLYEGDTIFRPADYQLRLTPIFNYSSTSSNGATTTTTSVGAQALFFEKHLRDVSAHYDFDSVRIGIQPVFASSVPATTTSTSTAPAGSDACPRIRPARTSSAPASRPTTS
jgi:hypothetical protein